MEFNLWSHSRSKMAVLARRAGVARETKQAYVLYGAQFVLPMKEQGAEEFDFLHGGKQALIQRKHSCHIG